MNILEETFLIEYEALKLMVEWACECGFGYDSIPDEYEEYKDEIEKQNLGYYDGIKYIVEQEARKKIKK